MQEVRAGAGKNLALIVIVLAVAFFYPRLLVRTLGLDSPWTPYLYLYGLGLVVFLIGLRIILRSRACRPGRGYDRAWLRVLLVGFVFFVALHGLWILAALRLPFKGGD